MRGVTVAQASGEDESEYLLRVEKLSRTMGFGVNEDVRKQFAVALAVNSLRESSVRKQLMQVAELTSTELSAKLKARLSARESEAILTEAKAGHYNVRKEIKQKVAKVSMYKCSDNSSNESDSKSSVDRTTGNKREYANHFDSPRRFEDGRRYVKSSYRNGDSSRSSSDSDKRFLLD